MTVGDLVKALSRFNPETPIVRYDADGNLVQSDTVELVYDARFGVEGVEIS